MGHTRGPQRIEKAIAPIFRINWHSALKGRQFPNEGQNPSTSPMLEMIALKGRNIYLNRRVISHHTIAIHSTVINIPIGKGMTCGVLRAGVFLEKNSSYTLLITLKSLPRYHVDGCPNDFVHAASGFLQHYLFNI